MTLKSKPVVTIRRRGHVAIWMKMKTFQGEGTDNMKGLWVGTKLACSRNNTTIKKAAKVVKDRVRK